jgi:hypothetical protein
LRRRLVRHLCERQHVQRRQLLAAAPHLSQSGIVLRGGGGNLDRQGLHVIPGGLRLGA